MFARTSARWPRILAHLENAMRLTPTLLTLVLLAPAAAQEIDVTTLVTAPGHVKLGPGAKVGYSVTQTFTGSGIEQRNAYAIVGEDADTFWVEHTGPRITALATTLPELEGAWMGLVVRKADGVVVEAWLGQPGQPLRSIGVAEAHPAPEPPPAKEGSIELPFGRVTVMIQRGPKGTEWIGLEGDLEGVLVKRAGPDGEGYELTAPPVEGERKLGEETLATRTLTYSNGQEIVLTDDPVIDAFFPTGAGGMLSLRAGGIEIAVSARGTDAQPQLDWDSRRRE